MVELGVGPVEEEASFRMEREGARRTALLIVVSWFLAKATWASEQREEVREVVR